MSEKSFEQAISELEEIIKELESGKLPLDDSINKFKNGVELANMCNKKLDEAQKSIMILTQDSNGNVEEKEFNV